MQILQLIVLFSSCLVSLGWAGSDSIKLSKIEVLTLYHGRMTNGRRSTPVPQLKCVGGTAGCKAFIPQVVQCYNRGSDGYDIQWECKTDMDNAYRFGQVSVSCEGYSYPDDPYVLKGSCGLEYTIDLTKEGYDSQKSRGHDYYGNSHQQPSYDKKSYSYSSQESSSTSSTLGTLIFLLAVGLVIYALYKTCIAPNTERMFQSSSTNDDFPGGNPYRYANAPPPPGFRPEFTPNENAGTAGASCGGAQGSGFSTGRGTGAGGFWTGAATGGILGYMFGNRNSGTNEFRSRGPSYTSNSNEFWGGTGGTTRRASGSSSGSSPSTGTRTASGFGGTTRR